MSNNLSAVLRKCCLPAILFLLILGPGCLHASAASLTSITSTRGPQEFADAWNRYVLPHAAGYPAPSDVWVERPSVSAPYTYGSLQPGFVSEGLDLLNFSRWLAGLPADVVLDPALIARQQAASMVNAANGVLSHSPSRPAGMEDGMFADAVAGTGSSNLSAGYATLGAALRAFLSDSDAGNIDRLGHRRWMLNPRMGRTMFGFAQTAGGYPYASMQAFDTSRPVADTAGYDAVAWPPAGLFPLEMFHAGDAWSLSLETTAYDKTRTSEIRVELTRSRDGRIWPFSSADADRNGRFFAVETSGYGVPFCIIFRPEGLEGLQSDDRFSVRVTGLYAKDGTPKEIRYETGFFRLADVHLPASLHLVMWTGETLQLRTSQLEHGISANPMGYSAYNGTDVASVTPDGSVTALKPGYAFLRAQPLNGEMTYIQVTVRNPDVSDPISSWARPGYALARVNGLTNGMDSGYARAVTRLEFAGLVVNLCEKLLGEKLPVGGDPFSDTSDTAVLKAYQAGILKGTSATTFSPSRRLTRQEAAALMMGVQRKLATDTVLSARLAGKGTGFVEASTVGAVVPPGVLPAVPFADAAGIAGWARADVDRAVALGLLSGMPGNRFTPVGNLTREQIFIMLQRQFSLFEP